MQKVYLLLRSNRQTGPYSLEELLQLNLKPFDLVWVEGRSAAWQYPSEIPSLNPYVPQTPQAAVPFQPIATSAMEEKIVRDSPPEFQSHPENPLPQKTELPKRVFVSIPKTVVPTNQRENFTNQNSFEEHKAYMPPVENPVYERKEEVKPITPSYSDTYRTHPKPVGEDPVHTNYARTLHDVEEDYTSWVYKQKTKKKPSASPKDMVLAVLILAVIGGGYYVMSRPSIANSVLPSNKAAAPTIQPSEEKHSEESKAKDITPGEQRMFPGSVNGAISTETKNPKNNKTKNPVTVPKGQTNSSVPSIHNSIPDEKTNPNIPDEDDNNIIREPETRASKRQTIPAEKKKKLGEVLKGIFSKKEKKDEVKNDAPVLEDPKPANNRQATRRDETSSSNENPVTGEMSTASLMEQIDLSSNAPENWMMGVKNLKISLKNRSNVTIQAASVTVSYYDENDQLLEKKLIYFSNVAPKAKATVSAPDHKFADHVDFKLTTISAKEDRYARY